MREHELIAALRNPGRLCITPTSLSGGFPYGGTSLGAIRAVSVRYGLAYKLIKAEEFGMRVVEGVLGQDVVVFAAILRGYNAAAVNTVFPNTSIGGATKERVIYSPYPSSDSDFRSGRRMTGKAVTLLFTPDDVKGHRAVLMRKAVPMLEEGARLALSAADEVETAVVFTAMPLEANKKPAQIGFLDDLDLS